MGAVRLVQLASHSWRSRALHTDHEGDLVPLEPGDLVYVFAVAHSPWPVPAYVPGFYRIRRWAFALLHRRRSPGSPSEAGCEPDRTVGIVPSRRLSFLRPVAHVGRVYDWLAAGLVVKARRIR